MMSELGSDKNNILNSGKKIMSGVTGGVKSLFGQSTPRAKTAALMDDIRIQQAAYLYYTANIAYVEVDHDGKLEKVFFRILPRCQFLRDASRLEMVEKANRNS